MLERGPGHSIDQRLQVHLKEDQTIWGRSGGGGVGEGASRREFRT